VTGSIVSPGLRQRIRGAATPIATSLGRLGLTPNGLTVIGFLGTSLGAYAAAQQAWLVAGILVFVFGIFDLFDGTLARATNRVSRFGAFLDSTLDRAGEAIAYLGIAGGLLGSGWIDAPIFAVWAMAAAFMVSYTRAKSESLGFTPGTGMASIGLMPREVRLVILSAGLIGGAILGTTIDTSSCSTCAGGAAIPLGILLIEATLALIAVGATITTIQRILHVRAQAKEG
jgi:CDP-diacylglycerol--glycerol-3-phosphate 3-phosphatidyltransferase